MTVEVLGLGLVMVLELGLVMGQVLVMVAVLGLVRALELMLGLVLGQELMQARMQVIAMARMQVRAMGLVLWRTTVSIRMVATALGMSPRRLLTRRQAIPRMATLCP